MGVGLAAALALVAAGSPGLAGADEPASSGQKDQLTSESGATVAPNLEHGRYLTDGTFGFSRSSLVDVQHPGQMASLWSVSAGTVIQYFFWDRVALGLGATYRLMQGDRLDAAYLSSGPSASVYPWVERRLALKLGAGFYWDNAILPGGFAPSGTRLDLNAGIQIFIAPSIAIGPVFQIDFTSGPRFASSPEFALAGGCVVYP